MILKDQPLTVATLIRKFLRPISLTWLLTLCETTLTALIPLFMGFAIDGLLKGDTDALIRLATILAGLIVIGVARRVYDTRAYGTIRVALGTELIGRSGKAPVSRQNARLGMGRELVDFLETEVPAVMNSVVQLTIALVILFTFHPYLSCAAMASAVLIVIVYWAFHGRFFRLNGEHNHQTEQQVKILESRAPGGILSHLDRLRRIEIRLSDTEAFVYGAIFLVLLAFIVFNLWFATTHLAASVGTIFSIISYSWEFVESALVLPMTLQGWSRLTEIMQRINRPQETA